MQSSSTRRQQLPVYKQKSRLLYAIEKYPVTIVTGHTGSGKSTQILQYLYEAGWTNDGSVLVCTQPRRLAAISLADHVASQVGCNVGATVGFSIRFQDNTDPLQTKIKFTTDGSLVSEIMSDPLLSKYSVIMVDEAHDRSLSTDLILALIKKILPQRPELRLIISSATLDATQFLQFFTHTPALVSVEGKLHHVQIYYLSDPTPDYIHQSIQTVLDIHTREPPGDILVFVTGLAEIQAIIRGIQQHENAPRNLDLLALYAGLNQQDQGKIFDSSSHRKVIVSTNVAEASITIDGIVYVVDCGYVKQRSTDAYTSIDYFSLVACSKSSAIQRAGRAGRTQPGKCFRLYTEQTYQKLMPDFPTPEFQRVSFAPVILQLLALHVDNVATFNYISPPFHHQMAQGLEILSLLGAINDDGKLTDPIGKAMAVLPLDPKHSKILISAALQFGCIDEAIAICAMQTVGNVIIKKSSTEYQEEQSKFLVQEGDHLTWLNIYMAFTQPQIKSASWCHNRGLNYQKLLRAKQVGNQLRKHLSRLSLDNQQKGSAQTQDIMKAIISGLFMQAACMQPDGSFQLVDAQATRVYAHPDSVMFKGKADWVVFDEIIEGVDGKIQIGGISQVETRNLLVKLSNGYYNETTKPANLQSRRYIASSLEGEREAYLYDGEEG